MKFFAALPRHKALGLTLGFGAAVVLLLLPPPGDLAEPAWRLCAVALCMAIWWSTEAIPVPVTGILPLILFPVLSITSAKDAVSPYANNIIFLVLGGFFLALAIERWQLHRRMALLVLQSIGKSGPFLVLGFMVPAGLASMLISNSAVTLMLIPVALAVLRVLLQDEHLSKTDRANIPVALLLCVAYAASIGGISTPIGTPPNALAVAYMEQELGISISFATWMLATLPFSTCMLLICWYVMTHWIYPISFQSSAQTRQRLKQMYRELGPLSHEERMVLLVFCATALGWIVRPLLNQLEPLAHLTDTGIALTSALVLFALPLGKNGQRLLDWEDTSRAPWGLLLMFGGGLSLAAAITSTGLSTAIGNLLLPLGSFGPLALVVGLCALIIFLTELSSNTATTATMLPVISALAIALGLAPTALIMPMILAVSCAFMLPIATMPNSIVYGSGHLTIPQMVRAGILLNLIGIVLASAFGYLLIPLLIG